LGNLSDKILEILSYKGWCLKCKGITGSMRASKKRDPREPESWLRALFSAHGLRTKRPTAVIMKVEAPPECHTPCTYLNNKTIGRVINYQTLKRQCLLINREVIRPPKAQFHHFLLLLPLLLLLLLLHFPPLLFRPRQCIIFPLPLRHRCRLHQFLHKTCTFGIETNKIVWVLF